MPNRRSKTLCWEAATHAGGVLSHFPTDCLALPFGKAREA